MDDLTTLFNEIFRMTIDKQIDFGWQLEGTELLAEFIDKPPRCLHFTIPENVDDEKFKVFLIEWRDKLKQVL